MMMFFILVILVHSVNICNALVFIRLFLVNFNMLCVFYMIFVIIGVCYFIMIIFII